MWELSSGMRHLTRAMPYRRSTLAFVMIVAILNVACSQTVTQTVSGSSGSTSSSSGGSGTPTVQATQAHHPAPDPYIPVLGKPPIETNQAQLTIGNADIQGQNIANGQGQFTLNFSAHIVTKNYDTMVFALVDNSTDPSQVTDVANNFSLLDFPLNIVDGTFPTVTVTQPCGPKNFRMDALGKDANTLKVHAIWTSPPVTVNLDCGTAPMPPHFITGFWIGSADNLTTGHMGNLDITFIQDSAPLQSGGTVYAISGRLTVFPPFQGSGPLNGTIDSQGNVTFHVNSDQVSGLSFDFTNGALDDPTDGREWSINGIYTASTGEHGNWGASC
jgi:hypothetical protein